MITGYNVVPCTFCGTRKEHLHLHTKKPCFVRCGRCGARGPTSRTPQWAVIAWNVRRDETGERILNSSKREEV